MTTLKRPALIAGLATTLFTATLLTGAPATAATRAATDPYGRLVVAALGTCDAQGAGRTYEGMLACVGGLAAPDPVKVFQMDLWNVFRDCLYLYYKDLNSMYPPGQLHDVNDCLEDHGYDVGP